MAPVGQFSAAATTSLSGSPVGLTTVEIAVSSMAKVLGAALMQAFIPMHRARSTTTSIAIGIEASLSHGDWHRNIS